MFARAVAIANRFTFPFVGLRRRADETLFTTVGAFVPVNEDGWVITSGHIVDEIMARERERGMLAGGEVPEAERHAAVSDRTEIWALPGFSATHPSLVEARVNRLADLGVCRLEPFDASAIPAFPVFRSASQPIEQGMSVCRLGFPFYDVEASFDAETGGFALDASAFPVPRFALDGIVARFHRRNSDDGSASAVFIETSTPGLRGQSGGPLLDVEGRICGIQSHTSHLDLGFDARYSVNGELVTERQFLNVGAASHVDEACALLDEVGAKYQR